LENVTFANNIAQGGAGGLSGGNAQGGALFTYKTTMTGSALVLDGNVARGGSTGGGGACYETGGNTGMWAWCVANGAPRAGCVSFIWVGGKMKGGEG
jgi:hypothetical protein